jgi:O-antigen ligase
MKQQLWLDKIIGLGFYLLVFLVPLVFLPVNYELFEFNKMLLVYLLTGIIAITWAAKMVMAKQIIFYRTPLDPFLVLFLVSQVISTMFSIDPHTSWWGYYSRFHGGLVSSLCYVLLYWSFVSNLTKNQAKKTVSYLLASACLVAGYGLLERMGIDKDSWVQDVQNRVFSTLGQPNWLAAYLDAVIFIPLALAINYSNKKNPKSIVFYLITFSLYLCLVFTKSKSGLAAFWAVLPIFYWLVWQVKNIKETPKYMLLNVVLFCLITLFYYPKLVEKLPIGRQSSSPAIQAQTLPSGQPVRIGGSPTDEIRRVVWKGALQIWQHYPVFGSGNETFAYAYFQYRPREHNDNSEWDFLYNKAHNEYLNYLACTGLVGLAAVVALQMAWPLWLLFDYRKKWLKTVALISVAGGLTWLLNPRLVQAILAKTIIYPPIAWPLLGATLVVFLALSMYFSRLKISNQPKTLSWLQLGLLSGFMTVVLTNFYGFSVVTIGLFSFLFPAISFCCQKKEQTLGSLNYTSTSWTQKILLGLVVSLGLFWSIKVIYLWNADRLYASGKTNYEQSDYLPAFEELGQAEEFNPDEPLFKSQLGETAAAMANLYYQSDSSQSGEIVQQLESLALAKGTEALLISPYNLNYYKSLAKIYLSLAVINQDYNQKAIDTLKEAAKLSPTDPKMLVNLGLLQKGAGQLEPAKQSLQKAIELKPDYDHAYVYLARLYKEQSRDDLARTTYQALLDHCYPPNKEAEEFLKH